MAEMVEHLTRIRIEGVASTERELRDYLLSAVEHMCDAYGRVWETEDAEVFTTRKGYWGRVTIKRKNLDSDEVKRAMP